MLDTVTTVYLIFMFMSLYFFSFFIILTVKNRKQLFSYPKPNINYFISVLIPVFNEEESIEDTIKHVLQINYPKKKLEIIVINDGSTDNTEKIVKKLIVFFWDLKWVQSHHLLK